jgi:hypothetical protein
MKKKLKIRQILGIGAFLFLFLTGFTAVFGWNFMAYFTGVMAILSGIWMMSEGGLKGRKARNYWFHLFTFGIGLLSVYIGLIMFPFLGMLKINILSDVSGYILMFSGLFAISEIFIQ